MRRLWARLREFVRDDASDGWVAATGGELPLVVALPIVLAAGAFCVFGGGIVMLLDPSWKAAVVLLMGLFFLWLPRQWLHGWRNRSRKRRKTQ